MQRPDFERLTVDKILIEACIIYTLFTYLCAGNQYRVNATGPMKIPQTIEMQVGTLNASEHNPRQITEDDFAELVKSLLLLPKGLYYRPVVVDDRNIALAGNMRLRALKYIHELGFDDLAEILRASYRFRHFDEAKQSALLNYWREWQMHPTVPTLYASELDEDEQQQFIIKDNLSFGTFDIDMLANEYDIAAIIDDGFDIDLLPKSAIEALAAANGIDPGIDPDELDDGFTLPSGDRPPIQQITFTLSDAQAEHIRAAIADVKDKNRDTVKFLDGNKNINGNALSIIIQQWEEQRRS